MKTLTSGCFGLERRVHTHTRMLLQQCVYCERLNSFEIDVLRILVGDDVYLEGEICFLCSEIKYSFGQGELCSKPVMNLELKNVF